MQDMAEAALRRSLDGLAPTNPAGHCPSCGNELVGIRDQLCLECLD